MKLASFFVIWLCSLFILFVGLDRAQNTKGFEMQLKNEPVETFGLKRKAKQCARPQFLQQVKQSSLVHFL